MAEENWALFEEACTAAKFWFLGQQSIIRKYKRGKYKIEDSHTKKKKRSVKKKKMHKTNSFHELFFFYVFFFFFL